MKGVVVAFLCMLSLANLYSQTDTSALRFFPSTIGNVWHYRDTPLTTITRDSVAAGSRYLFFDSSTVPSYAIDSTLEVFQYPTNPSRRRLRYKLTADVMQWWVSDTLLGGTVIDARVDSVFWGSMFGVPTQMKAIGYYYVQLINDSVYHNWRNEEYLAAGFGFSLSFYDPPWAPTEELVGCIINGTRYGTLTGVDEKVYSQSPSNWKFYPCYPNPFNPSTAISYSLPESGRITILVYDLLGKAVINLVNEFQEAGFHSVQFQPKNLPSGVYFVRLSARNFTATNKIVYAR